MKKLIALAIILIMALGALAACSSGDSDTKVYYGTSADYPPFEFIVLDEKNQQQYAGIDVELARQIATDMDKTLEIVNMDFNNLLTALSKGDLDFVIAAIEEDEERLKVADFSDPYYTDLPPLVLVRAEDASSYTLLQQLDGKTVGAQTGTTKAQIVTEEISGATLLSLSSVTDLVNNLAYNKCDALVLDAAVAQSYADSNPDFAVADIKLGEAFPYCVAVQKGDPKGLLPQINKTIKEAIDAGKIQKWETDALKNQENAIE